MTFVIATTQKELLDVLQLRLNTFVGELQNNIEDEITDLDYQAEYLAYYQDQRLVACARLNFAESTLFVSRLCVTKKQRHNNIGTQLMDYIKSYAKKQGATQIRLDAFLHAIPFYEKLGFTYEIKEPFD